MVNHRDLPLAQIDPAVQQLIEAEGRRIEQKLNLIASENYASQAVMAATGSLLTNKYAEGYSGKRYYAGCAVVDQAEDLAIARCKQLFDAEHVNVQPHSGSQANMGVYFAALQPGDTIMGMSLSEGGHLTHGHHISFSGVFYKPVQYGVNRDTECLDYEAMERLAQECRPKMIVVGASAYPRIIDFERCAAIAKSVGAPLLVDMAHIAGLVAAGVHPSPVPHADFVSSTTHKTLRGPRGGLVLSKAEHAQKLDKAIMPGIQGGPFMNVIAAKAVAFYEALQPDFVTYQRQIVANCQAMAQAFKDLGYRLVTGGTDNHLLVVDVRASRSMTGKEAETRLSDVGIYVNRNCIPFDQEKPWITSGIRLGTAAMTTRGMKESEVQQVVQLIHEALTGDAGHTVRVAEHIEKLCKQFPVYSRS